MIAVITLSVAIAFVTAFFNLYAGLRLRAQAGFDDGGRIATIGQNTGAMMLGLDYEVVATLAEEMTTVEAAAQAYSQTAVVGRDREEVLVTPVSRGFFTGLRPQVAFGRGLQESDHIADAEPVALLSYSYWQRYFNGDTEVLDTYLDVARVPDSSYLPPPDNPFSRAQPPQDPVRFRIVGIMARTLPGLPSAQFQTPDTALWLPLEPAWPLLAGVPESLSRAQIYTFVRRASGASASAVGIELRSRFGGAESAFRLLPGTSLDAIDGIVSNFSVARETRRQLWMFLTGSLLLALVAATNVSLFLGSRAIARQRELGIRIAVGAPVRRLARQLATEASLLVAISAAIGLLLCIWASAFLRGLPFFQGADWRDAPTLDWRAMALSVCFFVFLTAVVSLVPMLRVKTMGVAAAARWRAARAGMAQRLAGSAQLAAAGAVGGAAIAFGWHLGVLLLADPGFETSGVYAIEGVTRWTDDMEGGYRIELQRRREAIGSIPGVRSVAFGSPVPARPLGQLATPLPLPSNPGAEVLVYTGSYEQNYIDLLGLELVRGRVPAAGEESGKALVNQAFARSLWGSDDVVGERLPASRVWLNVSDEIVGVLKDVSFEHPSSDIQPFAFFSLASPFGSQEVAIVDTTLTAAELKQALDRLVADGELEIEVGEVRALEAMRAEIIAPDRARGILIAGTAVLLISITTLGCYGIQRNLAAATRREYAIRAALGAGPRSLFRLVMRRSIQLGLPGIALGGLLALIVVAWLKDQFVSREVSPALVTILVLISLTILLVGASFSSAREAQHLRALAVLDGA